MKELHSKGLGVRRSSDVISLSHEDKLFNLGSLGDSSPLQLLRTVIYMVGLHCTLRGGSEHNNLRRVGCNSQLSVERDDMGHERIVYKEDPLQKTNQGASWPKVEIRLCMCMLPQDVIDVQFITSRSICLCYLRVRNVTNYI